MGTLFVVSTPIGNLGDLSERAKETLVAADMIVAEDTRRTRKLLSHLGLSKPLRSLHAHNEAKRLSQVLDWLWDDQAVVMVSDAGTPLVSDPGERTVRAVIDAGHRVVPIPGPSAILAGLIGSGLPCARFTFLGFVPRKGRERSRFLERIAESPETVVVFESPERLVRLLDALADVIRSDRRVSIGRELTKMYEEFIRGTPAELADRYRDAPPRGEVTLVIAGATEEQVVSEHMIETAARAAGIQGLAPSAAARELAQELGIPRRDAYAVLQRLRDEGGEGT